MDILNESKPLENNGIMPFELFYLGELLAEGIIDQALFDATLPKLKNIETKYNEKELEL